MTNGSTAYGGAQGGWANWAYGVRHTAYGMVYLQCTARSPGSRDQTLASRGSGPPDQSQVVRNKQTHKQFRSQFRSRSRSQRSRGQGLVSGEPDPYDQSNSDQSCPGNAVLPYAVLPYYNTAVCRTAVLAYCRTPYCRAPYTICRTPY